MDRVAEASSVYRHFSYVEICLLYALRSFILMTVVTIESAWKRMSSSEMISLSFIFGRQGTPDIAAYGLIA